MTTTTDTDSSSCATRYPLLLLHGAGMRDGKKSRIWGRIPEVLRSQGAQVFFGEHDAWGTPFSNAVQLLEKLPEILAESGSTKINIIAHSKGGVDARHLLALLLEEPLDELPIASLTTIATPHHGSRSLEVLLSALWPIFIPIDLLVNRIYKGFGDENPDFLGTCLQLTPLNMREFNASQPDLSPVYSQQFASRLHGAVDDPLVFLPYFIVYRLEGPNDGLITLHSSSYDHFRGEFCTADGRGLSHDYLVDLPKRPFSSLRLSRSSKLASQPARERVLRSTAKSECLPLVGSRRSSIEYEGAPEGVLLDCEDIPAIYLSLVADLRARGY